MADGSYEEAKIIDWYVGDAGNVKVKVTVNGNSYELSSYCAADPAKEETLKSFLDRNVYEMPGGTAPPAFYILVLSSKLATIDLMIISADNKIIKDDYWTCAERINPVTK